MPFRATQATGCAGGTDLMVATQVYRIAQKQLPEFHIYSHTKAQSHKELFNMSI